MRAEVTAQVTRDLTEQHRIAEAGAREQSDALISDLEASVRILGVSLESALANVSELLGSLEALRSTADPAPRDGRAVARDRAAPGSASSRRRRAPAASTWTRRRTPRSTVAPATSVPSATAQFGTEPDEPEEPAEPDEPVDDPTSAETRGRTGRARPPRRS